MKTTVELQDDLLERSKRIAKREGVTLRTLLEEGLRLAIKARDRKRSTVFQMTTFKGDGLTTDFQNSSWARIRDEIYHDRG